MLANPSTGQAYGSFANLADIIIAEPGSVVGLSPIRTMIEATGRQLPADVHTAEYHLRRGLLDNVVDRESLRDRLGKLLDLLVEPEGIKLGRRAISRLQAPSVEDTETWESLAAATHDERPDALYYMRHILDDFFEVFGGSRKWRRPFGGRRPGGVAWSSGGRHRSAEDARGRPGRRALPTSVPRDCGKRNG